MTTSVCDLGKVVERIPCGLCQSVAFSCDTERPATWSPSQSMSSAAFLGFSFVSVGCLKFILHSNAREPLLMTTRKSRATIHLHSLFRGMTSLPPKSSQATCYTPNIYGPWSRQTGPHCAHAMIVVYGFPQQKQNLSVEQSRKEWLRSRQHTFFLSRGLSGSGETRAVRVVGRSGTVLSTVTSLGRQAVSLPLPVPTSFSAVTSAV